MIKGNLLYGQSGGPSSVINSTALGIIEEAKAHPDQIEKIYMMVHGIQGAIKGDFLDVTNVPMKELHKLAHTPGAFFGNVRYRLQPQADDMKDYRAIQANMIEKNIRYVFYNGGNDSMDTCAKLDGFLKKVHYEAAVIGLPKTIDNDLFGTDHTPGYGTSAKYIANSMAEIDLDNASYPKGRIIVCELMGRSAGWLTAASGLANLSGYGPDLIYVPEVPFNMNSFYEDVKRIYEKKKRCLIAVSEGIVDSYGAFIFQVGKKADSFGHFRLGGVGSILSDNINSELELTALPLEFSFLQRACCRVSSLQDQKEAEAVGREGVKKALSGVSGKMISIIRTSSSPYAYKLGLAELTDVANYEKKLPREYMNKEGNFISPDFISYALPLIQGEVKNRFESGIIDPPHIKGYNC